MIYHTGIGATQQQAASVVGSSLISVAPYAGPAAPFLAIAGAISNIVGLFGPNPNNTYTTEVVNQVEADVMKPNLAAWQALSLSDKTIANQQAALANFTNGWAYVVNACTSPTLGSAGVNCIADRQRGGKYDWWALYYDPIANDPEVAENTVQAQASVSNVVSSVVNSVGSLNSSELLLVGGLGIVGLWAVSKIL